MGDSSLLANLIISMLSLILSIIATWESLRAELEVNNVQKRIAEIEEERERARRLMGR